MNPSRIFFRGTSLLLASLLVATGVLSAADDARITSNSATATGASLSQNDEIAHLRSALAQQQKQLQMLQETLQNQQALLDKALGASLGTFTGIGEVASTSPIVPIAPLPAAAFPSPAPTLQVVGNAAGESSPLQLKIGDATITPVGFMDLTNTYRSTNAGTSLQTNFGSIPYNNGVTGRLSEDKLSAANSRIGFRVDAGVKGANVMGYYEGDFVGGVGDTAYNTQVSSNSLLYRIRLYWVDVRKSKFEFLAGQSWSMLTPNRKTDFGDPGGPLLLPGSRRQLYERSHLGAHSRHPWSLPPERKTDIRPFAGELFSILWRIGRRCGTDAARGLIFFDGWRTRPECHERRQDSDRPSGYSCEGRL